MAWLSIIFGGVILLLASLRKDKENVLRYFIDDSEKIRESLDLELGNAVNLSSLNKDNYSYRIKLIARNKYKQLGEAPIVKLIFAFAIIGIIAFYINSTFVKTNPILMFVVFEVFGLYYLYVWLGNRDRRQFEEAFPDALNMLTSAISSGESLMHTIIYVGKTLDSDVGKEFKLMGERLQMGEAPESVFRKACKRFPYPSFHFFVITINANIQRGGQLKDIITRLNRLMFDARAVDKKKIALTSEARASAKIVAAIPFLFIWLLQYLSPENYNYIMQDPSGRMVLYYVLVSEFLGIFIVWKLMKGVES